MLPVLLGSRLSRLLVAAGLLAEILAAGAASAQLTVRVEVGPGPTRPGDLLAVEVTATNTGVASVADVRVEVDVPAHMLSFPQSVTSSGGTCTGSGNLDAMCAPGETVTWLLGSLAAGSRKTVTFAQQVPTQGATPPNGTVIAYNARVRAGVVLQASASESATVNNASVFELLVDESADPVAPAADLAYTLTYGKLGAGTSAATTLSFPIPPGTSFVSATGGGIFSAGVVTWSLGTLVGTQGGSRQVTVHVNTPVAEGTPLAAIAQIQDAASASARAPVVTVVQSAVPLALEVEAVPDPVRPGETIDVALTVTNVGGTVIDPILELRVDHEIAAFLQNLTTHDGSCTGSGDLNATCNMNELVRWDLEPLSPGDRVTVLVPLAVLGGGGTPLTSTLIPLRAEVFEPLVGEIGESRIARQTVMLNPAPTFELAVDELDDSIEPGADELYTLSYSNTSAVVAAGTTLTFPVPIGTTFVSATGGGTLNAGVVSWNLGTVASFEGGTRDVRVHVDTPVVEGTVLRTVAQIQNAPANYARAPVVTVVQSGAPLTLTIEAVPGPVQTGETLEVQLTVTNVGIATVDPLLELRVDEDIWPFLDNQTTGGGTCTVSGDLNTTCVGRERVQWDLAPLAPGARVTVTAPLRVAFGGSSALRGTLIRMAAEVSEPLLGQTGESRLARQTARVSWVGTLKVLVDESADPVTPGANLTYTVTFGNTTTGSALGPILSLPLPPYTSFVSATNGGSVSAGVVSWNIPTLPSGQGGRREVTVQVDGGASPGSVLRTVAEIHEHSGSARSARAPTATVVGSGAPLTLTVAATPDPARPANVLDVEYTVTNVSGSLVSGAILEARLPDDMVSFLQSAATGAADCTVSGTGDTSCDARERVRWTLPALAANDSVVVSIPPQIPTQGLTPPNGTLIRFVGLVDGSPAAASDTVRVGFLDTDLDGVVDGIDNCGALANPTQTDGDGDLNADLCDDCPTIGNITQADVDDDLVGDACDNCVAISNSRVAANFLTTNPWATLTGGQRDDDHDGYGNKCDAKFVGMPSQSVGGLDLAQFRASNNEDRRFDTCGTSNTRACAIFDLDEAVSGNAIGGLDLGRFRQLSNTTPGPRCAACTGTGSIPLPCTAGTAGTCF